MDELIALPIKGESFLLRRGGKHVLVDGGWNGRDLNDAINDHDPNISQIDIIVCTHGDADHARGLATFLDYWIAPAPRGGGLPKRVGQFWLPGKWADVLPELITNPRDFVARLILELDQLKRNHPDIADHGEDVEVLTRALDQMVSAERQVGDRASHSIDGEVGAGNRSEPGFANPEPDIENSGSSDDPPWLTMLRENVGKAIRSFVEAERAFSSGKNRVRYRFRRRYISGALAEFWIGLIDTAKAIREIANQAIKYGVRIRWFDFDAFTQTKRPKGGVPGFLIPLNAVEQTPAPRTNISYLAQLSQVNEESLVFFAPPFVDRLGVIFCGDSPLGDGPSYGNSFLHATPQPVLPVVATAPHHGSESNKSAYSHLKVWCHVPVWLKAGGSWRQPGPTFQLLRFPERICTQCPRSGLKLQKAGVASHFAWPYASPIWVIGHKCVCT